MRGFFLFSTALLLLPAAPFARAQERWAIVGAWDIGFYPSTGGCLAYASFEETAFFIGYDTRAAVPALDITVLDERWSSIEADRRYPITLAFGDQLPWTLEMKGVFMDGAPGLQILIDASIEKSGQFLDEFRREMEMVWSYGDAELGTFTLRGSAQAFEEVRACQEARATARVDQASME